MTLAYGICAVLRQIFIKCLLCAIHRAAYWGHWDRCGATFKNPALVRGGQAFTGPLPACGVLPHRCPVSERGQIVHSGGHPTVPGRRMQRSPWKSVCINLTLGGKHSRCISKLERSPCVFLRSTDALAFSLLTITEIVHNFEWFGLTSAPTKPWIIS